MPSLVNELSPSQRTWLYDTFGQFEENDELQPVPHYQPRENRFPDVPRDPFQYQPTPHDFDDSPDNRNSIFRRGGKSPTVSTNEKPQSWSPTSERLDLHHFDTRGFRVSPPFQPSSARNGPPVDLTTKLADKIGGKMAPIYPHIDDKLTWQQSFENLQVYKRAYGDCNVPQKYKLNIKLGGWVVSTALHLYNTK